MLNVLVSAEDPEELLCDAEVDLRVVEFGQTQIVELLHVRFVGVIRLARGSSLGPIEASEQVWHKLD